MKNKDKIYLVLCNIMYKTWFIWSVIKLQEDGLMEAIDFFTPEEQTILEGINENAFEYLGGVLEMTPRQEEVVKRYITLKLLMLDLEQEGGHRLFIMYQSSVVNRTDNIVPSVVALKIYLDKYGPSWL